MTSSDHTALAIDYPRLEAGVNAVMDRWKPPSSPICTAILGSGWSSVIDQLDVVDRIPFRDIPALGTPAVTGHEGSLALCRISNRTILIFQGRRHWYEGEGWTPIAFPVYLAKTLGSATLLLTNAAGGIRCDLTPGDLMLLNDHINMMGVNPLVGPHNPAWGVRFPDMSAVYSPSHNEMMKRVAASLGIEVKSGVYLAASGPTYETPAEIQTYRSWGADAIGMSTVPEAILGHAAGIPVTAVSCITNTAAAHSRPGLSHDEVLATTQRRMPDMSRLLSAYLHELASS